MLVVGGSEEIPGAAIFAGLAALRAGAGKLAVAVPQGVARAVAIALPEARVLPLPGRASLNASLEQVIDRSCAILIGPGMQNETRTLHLAHRILDRARDQAVILDALALGAVRDRDPHTWLLATPHAGEMAHLTGQAKEAICTDPVAYACAAAELWQATILLKGSTSIIAAPSNHQVSAQTWRFNGGEIGLATSGSGDVQAGLALGLAARGMPAVAVAAWTTWIHAACGKALSEVHGGMGYLARELLDVIPGVLNRRV